MPGPRPADQPFRRPRISRQFLEDHRRRRYVDAAAELFHELGREGPSVTNVVRRVGTARGSFYEVFRSAEDCIGYGVGVAVEKLFATFDGQDGREGWLAEVEESIAGFYSAVAAEPMLAELFLIHAADSRVEHGRAAARAGVERFTALFGRGRALAEARGRPLPASVEEYFSCAVVSLAARRLGRGETERLPEESIAMTELIGGFYLGPRAADGVLAGRRPGPGRPESGRAQPSISRSRTASVTSARVPLSE